MKTMNQNMEIMGSPPSWYIAILEATVSPYYVNLEPGYHLGERKGYQTLGEHEPLIRPLKLHT